MEIFDSMFKWDEKETCEYCKFWASEKEDDVGMCMRFPPKIISPPADDSPHNVAKTTLYPVVSMFRTCGEFKQNQ